MIDHWTFMLYAILLVLACGAGLLLLSTAEAILTKQWIKSIVESAMALSVLIVALVLARVVGLI